MMVIKLASTTTYFGPLKGYHQFVHLLQGYVQYASRPHSSLRIRGSPFQHAATHENIQYTLLHYTQLD